MPNSAALKDDLEEKITEVIRLLEKEINSRERRMGVYKKLLKAYSESLEECKKGNFEKVYINGSVRFYYDSMVELNEELLNKMGEAIHEWELLRVTRG